MAVLTFPAPDPREGDRLAASIETATGHPAEVVLNRDEWRVTTDAAEADVKAVVDAHDGTPDPVGPSAEERLAALESEVNGIKDRAAAATVTDPDAKAVADAVSGAA